MAERIELLLRVRRHPYDREGEEPSHFSVICEGLTVGTIYLRTHLAGDDAPWFWSVQPILAVSHKAVASSGREATREAAMLAFRRSFERIKIAIGEQTWADFREHMRRVNARSGGSAD